MNTRPVEPADEAEWLQMRAALWSDQEPTESGRTVRQFLVAPGPALQPMLHAVLVCPRATGGLCGFVELSIRPYAEGCETNRVGYIEGWYVDPDIRHRCVGRRLIAAAEAWARGQGCSEMASDAELDNLSSQQAHQRLSYTEVERIVCFRKALSEAE
jgi:aminoglycoside 6'-N-acetyltransferase I